MARLRHPHICSVFGISRVEAGASPGATAVVMEFLDSSLSELLHAQHMSIWWRTTRKRRLSGPLVPIAHGGAVAWVGPGWT